MKVRDLLVALLLTPAFRPVILRAAVMSRFNGLAPRPRSIEHSGLRCRDEKAVENGLSAMNARYTPALKADVNEGWHSLREDASALDTHAAFNASIFRNRAQANSAMTNCRRFAPNVRRPAAAAWHSRPQ